MTYNQLKLILIIAALALGMGIATVYGESQPLTLEGRALKIELNAYIENFTTKVGITDGAVQWTVMVLPVLEMDGPAVIYGWLIPPPHRFTPGDPEIWIALFTFHETMMLTMPPKMRRVVAGHEVAHMTTQCMGFPEPNLDGLDELAATLLLVNHAIIVESCADIVSAKLTSAKDVLATLHFLKETWSLNNPVLLRRIQVMARVIQREEQHHE